MKMNEIKGLETKELAERIESEVAKYNQMKMRGIRFAALIRRTSGRVSRRPFATTRRNAA